MALITITGYPSSGKSKRSLQIKQYLDQRLNGSHNVLIVSDGSLNIPRSAYDDGRAEKPARGTLFTAVQRQLSRDTVLIVDAPNYIKGFRYQMYCAAREMKLRVCTVFVVATPDLCREWHSARPQEIQYNPQTLQNLFLRYEEPSSMVRWDSPLFSILPEDDIPGPQIYDAISSGVIKPPNSGTLSVSKAPTDALLVLEKTTLAIVSAIIGEQTASQGLGISGTIVLPINTTLRPRITLPARNITLPELHRLKRQFVTVHKKAVTLGTTEKGDVDWDEEHVAQKFVIYLEDHLRD